MDDYISRGEAIAAIKEIQKEQFAKEQDESLSWSLGFQNGLYLARRDIADIPAADVRPKWISVEEKLPKPGDVVLLYRSSVEAVTLGYLKVFGGFMHLWDCLRTPYGEYETPWVGAGIVKYWMPLPEPPKEGGGEDG